MEAVTLDNIWGVKYLVCGEKSSTSEETSEEEKEITTVES